MSKHLHVDSDVIHKIASSTHKFSHLQWKMIAYEITISSKIEGLTYVTKDDLSSRISIPSAFKAYKNYIFNS